jgi:hypothetical protein
MGRKDIERAKDVSDECILLLAEAVDEADVEHPISMGLTAMSLIALQMIVTASRDKKTALAAVETLRGGLIRTINELYDDQQEKRT